MKTHSMRSACPKMRPSKVSIILGLLAVVAAACAQDSTDITAGPLATAKVSCERPRVTGTGDAFRYPASLDEMVTDSDVVVEGRVVGDADEATENSQPMEVAVEATYRGNAGASLTVQRLQTRYTVNGTPGTFVGSWSGEPWYCPGEAYMLFLKRQPDGTFQALSRLGAIPIAPHPDARTVGTGTLQAPEPFGSLASLDADTLRAQVRSSVDRAGH